MRRRFSTCLALLALPLACEPDTAPGASDSRAVVDSGFAAVADSAWVDVSGLTLVGFYPVKTNEQLQLDADLATTLDDFAFHLGSAMDSLVAAGVTVHYRGGDTVWFRTPLRRWRFARSPDSADVGYVLADTLLQPVVIHGVRTYVDLIEYVREFRRTGRVTIR